MLIRCFFFKAGQPFLRYLRPIYFFLTCNFVITSKYYYSMIIICKKIQVSFYLSQTSHFSHSLSLSISLSISLSLYIYIYICITLSFSSLSIHLKISIWWYLSQSVYIYRSIYPVSWNCRIHQLHLCRGVKTPPTSDLHMALNNLMVRFQ